MTPALLDEMLSNTDSALEKPNQTSQTNNENLRLSAEQEFHRLIGLAQDCLTSRDLNSANYSLRRAASLQPWRKEPLIFLASVEALEGRHDEAIELLGAASILAPTDPEIFCKLGTALAKRKRFAEAATIFLRQHELVQSHPGPLHNAGVCFHRANQISAADEALTKITKLFPNWPDGHRTLSTFLREQNRFSEALQYLLNAIRIAPDQPQDLIDLGAIRARIGEISNAVNCFKRACLLDPKSRSAFDNLLSSALCDSSVKRSEIEALLRRANSIYPTPVTPLTTQALQVGAPNILRLGFVSPDLYRHPVTCFLLPLINGLDKNRFEIVIFSNSSTRDAITQQIRESVDLWEDISALNDEEACERARELAIDALIDLTGHFQSNRLGMFALRAAPIQITMIGCMSTTGLAEMDYRITDSGLDPLDTDVWCSEKLVRLDCGAVCLEEPSAAPDIGPLPAVRNGYITFGSFNNLAKVSPAVLTVWATTLKMISNSRLHVVAEQGSSIVERLGDLGIVHSRITVLNRMPEPEYLAAHRQVDVILDTFPYNGFTVTLLAAFMGVPCLTCRGEMPTARTASTVMSKLGLDSFVASTCDDIPHIAEQVCKDLSALESIRASLRDKMRRFWMDGPAYAAEFSSWLTAAVHRIAMPEKGRPPLGASRTRKSEIKFRRDCLKSSLLSLIQSPTLQSQALEEIFILAEKSGLREVSDLVLNRLDISAVSKPEVAVRLLETRSRSDKPDAINQCIKSDWHLRDPSVANWLCSQLSDPCVHHDALNDFAARWSERPDAPPSLLLEHAKSLALSDLPWHHVETLFRKAIHGGANPYSVWMAISSAAASRQLISVALDAAKSALFHRPGDPEAIAWLGGLFNEAGNHQAALNCTEVSVRVFPNHGAYFLSHALALEKLFKFDEAIRFASKAVELSPENPETHKHLAYCAIRVSRADKAVSQLQRAAQLFPNNQIIASNLLYCENYIEQSDTQLFNKHFRYQLSLDQHGVKSVPRKSRITGKIRLALLSGDFRRHSVSYFVKPWVDNIDRSRFEVILVSTSRESDQITEQLRARASEWVDASSLFDDDLATALRAKNLDILCDLSGHTQGNRMSAFARRCAPWQVTMIGAMQTSGLREMDFRVTDHWIDPQGTTEHLHTEKLIRLKIGGWVFAPPDNMPEVRPLPALKNGYITFGSFNNTAKITPCVLDAWAQILVSVQHSRLMINGFHFPTIRDGLVERGIESRRLEFIGRPAGLAYYEQHHRVDVALDTFPFNGLTVSCFAAWMGVPTLSHAEVRPASRVGYAIASRLGISGLTIANNRDNLPSKAVELTKDLSRLSILRSTLRARMRASITEARRWTDELSGQFSRMVSEG